MLFAVLSAATSPLSARPYLSTPVSPDAPAVAASHSAAGSQSYGFAGAQPYSIVSQSDGAVVSLSDTAASQSDTAAARQSGWSLSCSVELQSRYVWRGQALGGNAPALEPVATLAFKGLSLGVWGAYSLGAEAYQELDWTLAYAVVPDLLTVQVTDYANPQLHAGYHYFDYAAPTTPHLLEGGLLLSVPKTDLSLGAFVNFFGNDARRQDGTLNYSIYVEMAYALQSQCLQSDFSFAVGAALNGEEGYSFYGNDGFSVVNVSAEARRAFRLSPSLSLPLYLRLVANPCAGKLHCLMGTVVAF